MGGAARHDAYYLRLFARGMEELGDPESIALACATWDRIPARGGARRMVHGERPGSRHALSPYGGRAAKAVSRIAGGSAKNRRPAKPKVPEELYFLYPEKLYERACALDPHFESFSQWMDWAKRDRPGTAEKWPKRGTKSARMDIEPILLLMEEKEKRNAFHTSLQYLAKAERIDSVHPAVRRARLRLLAASVLRHLQQKKARIWRRRNWPRWRRCRSPSRVTGRLSWRPCATWSRRFAARGASRRASRGSGARARKQSGCGAADLRRGPCFEAGRARKAASHRRRSAKRNAPRCPRP
jgi:hypothetical protein